MHIQTLDRSPRHHRGGQVSSSKPFTRTHPKSAKNKEPTQEESIIL